MPICAVRIPSHLTEDWGRSLRRSAAIEILILQTVSQLERSRAPDAPIDIHDLVKATGLDVNEVMEAVLALGREGSLATVEIQQDSSSPNIDGIALLAPGRKALRRVTEPITDWESLTHAWGLNLSCRSLTTIPEEAYESSLVSLNLQGNQLIEISDEISHFTELRELNASGNKIKWVSPRLAELPHLVTLDLRKNRISDLQAEIGRSPSLVNLYLEDNPLSPVTRAAYNQGLEPFLRFQRSLEDAVRNYEAKLLVLGEGDVGKSSLVAALLGEPFVPNRPTTHGITVKNVEMPAREKHDQPLTLHIWDFGGQPIYQAINQFFYSRRSLYLLVWDPRSGPEKCDVLGWLNRIRLRVGPGARVILVSTWASSTRLPRIDLEGLDNRFPGAIRGHFAIDSHTGKGLQALLNAIHDEMLELEHIGERISRRWVMAREDLLAQPGPIVSYHYFEEICRRHEMNGADAATLARILSDLGYIFYFASDEGLSDEIVLDPEWITRAISRVFEDEATLEGSGVLEHKELERIWSLREGEDELPRQIHGYLLRLMEKFDVSYRLDDERSLVGELVPYARPDDLSGWIEPREQVWNRKEKELRFHYELSDSPAGLIKWLIVRSHRYAAKPARHWQTGFALEHGRHGRCIVELVDRDLRVRCVGAWPNHLANIVRGLVETLIADRWPGLDSDLRLPCPTLECFGSFRESGVSHLIFVGRPTVFCETCKADIDVGKLAAAIESPNAPAMIDQILIEGIEDLKDDVRAIDSKLESYYLELLSAFGDEARECPRLFTITPIKRHSLIENPAKFEVRLNLWCEMPGSQHPTCKIGSGGPGEYHIKVTRDWLRGMSPVGLKVAKLLRVVIPILGMTDPRIMTMATGMDQLLDDMVELLNGRDAIKSALDDVPVTTSAAATTSSAEAEGPALRALNFILRFKDPTSRWGHLRRAPTSEGGWLWLCPEHYELFDPGVLTLGQGSK